MYVPYPAHKVNGFHKNGLTHRAVNRAPARQPSRLRPGRRHPIVVWSDIRPQSGGTFAACDSVPRVARFLLDHPEGVLPSGGFGNLVSRCTDFAELTGETGDVVLLHPFILHAASQNPSGRPRFITNPPVALKEPMNFNRPNPEDFSLTERAVLRGLGVDRLDFRPTAPRERIVPERVRRQQKMLEEQKARLEQTTPAQEA